MSPTLTNGGMLILIGIVILMFAANMLWIHVKSISCKYCYHPPTGHGIHTGECLRCNCKAYKP